MPARTTSPGRKRSAKTRNACLPTWRDAKPGVDYPIFLPNDPTLVLPGFRWAQQFGFDTVKSVTEEDAKVIIETLQLSDDDASAAFFAITGGNHWRWLEAYSAAHGDFSKLKLSIAR